MESEKKTRIAEIPGLETIEYGAAGRHGRLDGFHVVEEDAPASEPADEEALVGPKRDAAVARVPGDARSYEQPVDVASDSQLMPAEEPVDLEAAERAADDPRHVLRGTAHMASSKGSS